MTSRDVKRELSHVTRELSRVTRNVTSRTVKVVVLWRVSRTFKHVQHPLSDDKSSENVDEGDKSCCCCQSLNSEKVAVSVCESPVAEIFKVARNTV